MTETVTEGTSLGGTCNRVSKGSGDIWRYRARKARNLLCIWSRNIGGVALRHPSRMCDEMGFTGQPETLDTAGTRIDHTDPWRWHG